MAYVLSPRLFVENGPAILASRRRSARSSAAEYELLKIKPSSAPAADEDPDYCRAA